VWYHKKQNEFLRCMNKRYKEILKLPKIRGSNKASHWCESNSNKSLVGEIEARQNSDGSSWNCEWPHLCNCSTAGPSPTTPQEDISFTPDKRESSHGIIARFVKKIQVKLEQCIHTQKFETIVSYSHKVSKMLLYAKSGIALKNAIIFWKSAALVWKFQMITYKITIFVFCYTYWIGA